MHRRIRAYFQSEEYEDPLTGRRRIALRVPYMGYEAPNGSDPNAAASNGGGAAGETPF